MAERWVINASPVILLAKSGVISLLPELCDELVVPAGVVAEVQAYPTSDAGINWLQSEGAAYVRTTANHPAMDGWRGGAGEAEVISWAMLNPGFTAILDDRQARALALRNGINVIGSLRVIVLAKEKGFIARARPALESLSGEGAWVSKELIRRAIELAGE